MEFSKQKTDFNREKDKIVLCLYEMQFNKKEEMTFYSQLIKFNFKIKNNHIFELLVELANTSLVQKDEAHKIGFFNEDFEEDEYYYRITISGINYINELDDEYCEELFRELNFNVNTNLNTKNTDLDWQPLPVENEIQLKSALEKTEKAFKAIEADNGYAATKPQERKTVVEALKAGYEILKNNELTKWAKDNLLIEPLKKALKTFAESRIGGLIKDAIEFLTTLFN